MAEKEPAAAAPARARKGVERACAAARVLSERLLKAGGGVMAVHPDPGGPGSGTDEDLCESVARLGFLAAAKFSGAGRAGLRELVPGADLRGRFLEILFRAEFDKAAPAAAKPGSPPAEGAKAAAVAALRAVLDHPRLAVLPQAHPSAVFLCIGGFASLPAGQEDLAARACLALKDALSEPGRPAVVCAVGPGAARCAPPQARVGFSHTAECVAQACRPHGSWGEATARAAVEERELSESASLKTWAGCAKQAQSEFPGADPKALNASETERLRLILAPTRADGTILRIAGTLFETAPRGGGTPARSGA